MAIVASDHVDIGRDAALVERTQAGEIEAFEDLYRRYFPRLRRFCMRYLHDPADAEEVAQEALARAYRSIATLGGDKRFYPWLSVIAKRLCIDYYRRQSRLELGSRFEPAEVEAAADERIVDLSDQQLVRSALGALSVRHREVLERREVDGWSYQRIADTYGVSVGTVEQLLHRARKSLRKSFLELDGQSIGAAAGIPVLGWVSRRWTRFRVAFHARASKFEEVLSPLSARAAGLAIVAGAAGIGGFGGAAAQLPSSAAVPRVKAVVTAKAESASPAGTPAALASGSGGAGLIGRGGRHGGPPAGGTSSAAVYANPHADFQVAHHDNSVGLPMELYLRGPFAPLGNLLNSILHGAKR